MRSHCKSTLAQCYRKKEQEKRAYDESVREIYLILHEILETICFCFLYSFKLLLHKKFELYMYA